MASRKDESKSVELPSFPVILGTCLGYKAFRGFAPLKDLARISSADIFDQDENRLGTQRNLSVQHAREAHKYVSTVQPAFYPELILNVRDSSYFTFAEMHHARGARFGLLKFKRDPRKGESIVVSRLDGNHRLWFADGHDKGLAAVNRTVSFCMLAIEDLEKELELFRDINDNQMGMNTSHLQNIAARLMGDKLLKLKEPALYIVQKLMKDKKSPLFGRVFEGGKVQKGATLSGLTVANLTSAVKDMLSRSSKLGQFPDADAQYKVIKNYWEAVKMWLPKAWSRPRDYVIFKGVGLYAISYVGIELIDRSLAKGKFTSEDMLKYLNQLPSELLASGTTAALSGRGGGRKLANDLIVSLDEEGEVSVSKLQKLILDME
jgi:DGQHR domain-containing protein